MKKKIVFKKLISILLVTIMSLSVVAVSGFSASAASYQTRRLYANGSNGTVTAYVTPELSPWRDEQFYYNCMFKPDNNKNTCYIYNYMRGDILSFFLDSFPEIDEGIRNNFVTQESIFASPCAGYRYDKKSKIGFAYATTPVKRTDTCTTYYLNTRLVFFETVTSYAGEKISKNLSDRIQTKGVLRVIGHYSTTQRVRAKTTDSYYICNYEKDGKATPIITAYTDHKQDYFTEYKEYIDSAYVSVNHFQGVDPINHNQSSSTVISNSVSILLSGTNGVISAVLKDISNVAVKIFQSTFFNSSQTVNQKIGQAPHCYSLENRNDGNKNNIRAVSVFVSPDVHFSTTFDNPNDRYKRSDDADNIRLVTTTASVSNKNYDVDYTASKRKIKYAYQFSVRFENPRGDKNSIVDIAIVDSVQYGINDGEKYALDAPKNFKAKISSNGLKVSWSKVSGAKKYALYVLNNNVWKKLTTTTNTYYFDKQVTSGKTYTYAVRAVSSAGDYATGKMIKTSALYLIPPTLTATKVSNGIKLQWNKVAGANKYNLYYYSYDGSRNFLSTVTTNSFTYKVPKSNKVYYFMVQSVSSSGVVSNFSSSVKITY